ncbi:kinase-like protein [Neolentinus lepideus HHB14362 ss-1]|uniref:Kinase-like protein n=1 Tax=Neolentinus lepideus HHB14362 ss-1 TaxID=1314782 RepID=A0A165W2S1_9AGAM|nr:kinase-like protein [Neolentinus lepideus HHB14362 ss-1]
MFQPDIHVHQQTSLHNQPYNGPSSIISHAHLVPHVTSHFGSPQPPPPQAPPAQQQSNRQAPQQAAQKEPVIVDGIPSVTLRANDVLIGDSNSRSTRTYTPLKVVGDGSFGTVWLCDWHGPLPPNTPLSAMQCGAGARPEWAGKRLVAVKRMKKKWEGGWEECRKLKELESLRAIPYHPNIIPLYDAFLLPTTKELYFVFESMEGNLYQLIKSRKGRPLAGGLVSSIFKQVISGLHHIHASGYFHRDMKPENLLVTTTGLYDYTPVSPIAPLNAPMEKDVVVIVKLADFGLARETKSKPPYTEYVSTRWYRAPEVLLRSRDYSNPVDMWALGTIMAELVNLRPLFPGQGEIDQVARICEVLGDPGNDYGHDTRGKSIGGGRWTRGIKMAKSVGFVFPKVNPKNMYALFDPSVPVKLVDCIADLLKYDPDVRLTSQQCMTHPYLLETAPKNNPPIPSLIYAPAQSINAKLANGNANPNSVPPRQGSLPSVAPRNVPPSHSHTPAHAKPAFDASLQHLRPQQPHIPDAASSHRSSFYPSASSSSSTPSQGNSQYAHELRDYAHSADTLNSDLNGRLAVPNASALSSSVYSFGDGAGDRVANASSWIAAQAQHSENGWPMDVSSPQNEYASGQPMEIQQSPIVQEYPTRPLDEDGIMQVQPPQQGNKLGSKLNAFGFGKKSSKWGLGMFGGHSNSEKTSILTPVDELNPMSGIDSHTSSLKRTQSSSTDSRSLDSPGVSEPPGLGLDPKKVKEEAKRSLQEAEKQRRELAKKMQREQARAVMQKRNQVLMQQAGQDLEWKSSNSAHLLQGEGTLGRGSKGKAAASGSHRQHTSGGMGSPTVNAAGARFGPADGSSFGDWRRDSERFAKARRRDWDDDHSMSSSDMHSSLGRMSVISFATVDSDPGPARLRSRPSLFGIDRMTSTSSLRTSFGDDAFPGSPRSSNSLSLEQELAQNFHLRASMDPGMVNVALPNTTSPPPLRSLSLSPTGGRPSYISMPPPIQTQHLQAPNFGLGGQVAGHPPSPGQAPKSAINPMFNVKVPPLPSPSSEFSSPPLLPSFAHLEAVAEGEYPPLSPMSFTTPEDIS